MSTRRGAAQIVTVYAVFGDRGEADRIGHAAIDEKLAACVNILGQVESIYRWQGRVETASECAALFKTRADLAQPLVDRIVDLHSYENPAVVIWPIEGAPPLYLAWVDEQCR